MWTPDVAQHRRCCLLAIASCACLLRHGPTDLGRRARSSYVRACVPAHRQTVAARIVNLETAHGCAMPARPPLPFATGAGNLGRAPQPVCAWRDSGTGEEEEVLQRIGVIHLLPPAPVVGLSLFLPRGPSADLGSPRSLVKDRRRLVRLPSWPRVSPLYASSC